MKNMDAFSSNTTHSTENLKMYEVKTEDFIFYTMGVDILNSIKQSEHSSLSFSEILDYKEVDEIPFAYKTFMLKDGENVREILNMDIITKLIQSCVKNIGEKVEILLHRRFVYTIESITDTHVYFTTESFSRDWNKS